MLFETRDVSLYLYIRLCLRSKRSDLEEGVFFFVLFDPS